MLWRYQKYNTNLKTLILSTTLINADTVERFDMKPAGKVQMQGHADSGKAVINPRLLHMGHGHHNYYNIIPTENGHVHPSTRPGTHFIDGLADAMWIK